MSPKSKELSDLQKVWYKKLKKSGFNDLEYDEDTLKQYSSSKIYRGRLNGKDYVDQAVSNHATEAYYRLAGHFLHDYKFDSERERTIWFHHSEGKSFREIARALRTRHYKANKDSINVIIKRLAAEMMKTRSSTDDQE